MNRPADSLGLGPDDAGLEGVARELEAYADETRLAPPPDLTDRIMAAVADEPTPTPPATFLHAVGALRLMDAWRAWRLNLRIALGSGPASGRLRMQALAVVVVAALLVGLGGTTVAVGAAQLVQAIVAPSVSDPDALPSPLEVSPSPDAVPTPSPDLSPSPDPSASPDASDEPGESDEPDESGEPEESDDSSGSSGGSSTSATPRPDRTPDNDESDDDETDDPGETDDPDETATPEPDDTPKPTSTSGGSGSGGSDSGS
jgi:hypothetical protein